MSGPGIPMPNDMYTVTRDQIINDIYDICACQNYSKKSVKQ